MCRTSCLERGTIRLCEGMRRSKGRNMTPYELAGVGFGLLSVWLTVKRSIWCWPTGIVSVAAFALLFFEIKLYADMLLQVFFLVTSFLGWYLWLHGGRDRTELPISTLSRMQVGML